MQNDPRPTDLTFDEGRYVRLPIKAFYILGMVWSGMIWGYFDLRAQVDDTKKVSAATAVTVSEDHSAIIAMHDDVLKISDFVNESQRMYNRYFRDYTDPDYKKPIQH